MTTWLTPESLPEVEDIVKGADQLVTIAPSPLSIGLPIPWNTSPRPSVINGRSVTYLRPRLDSLFEVMAEDFIATVPVSWTLEELNHHLSPYGLTLPHSRLAAKHLGCDERLQAACDGPFNHSDIHNLIGFNPPHWLEAQRGTWRDWVLGMTAITADGKIIKSGSKVTKSVAGFDIHKFIIGSRSAFLIPLTVTLRVVPIASLTLPDLVWGNESRADGTLPNHLVHRVLPADFEAALKNSSGQFQFADRVSSTVYHLVNSPAAPRRFPGDWLMGTGEYASFPEFSNAETHAIRRAKELFDPLNKLNPGVLGIV